MAMKQHPLIVDMLTKFRSLNPSLFFLFAILAPLREIFFSGLNRFNGRNTFLVSRKGAKIAKKKTAGKGSASTLRANLLL
jgi:hypothetical protein